MTRILALALLLLTLASSALAQSPSPLPAKLANPAESLPSLAGADLICYPDGKLFYKWVQRDPSTNAEIVIFARPRAWEKAQPSTVLPSEVVNMQTWATNGVNMVGVQAEAASGQYTTNDPNFQPETGAAGTSCTPDSCQPDAASPPARDFFVTILLAVLVVVATIGVFRVGRSSR